MRRIRLWRAAIAPGVLPLFVLPSSLCRSLSTAALPKNMQPICETLGWDCGACWCRDEGDHLLHCVETWSVASSEVTHFVTSSKQFHFAPTSPDIIARVWRSGEPLWIEDVSREPGYQRASIASQAGLHAVFAFPIGIGGEVRCVMEFYMS
jgi:hypothetical protein